MASIAGWNKNLPSDQSSAALGAAEFRSLKSFMQAWWEEEHYGTDGSSGSAGMHKVGSARAYVGSADSMPTPREGAIFFDPDERGIYVGESGTTWRKIAGENSSWSWKAQHEFVAESPTSVLISTRTSGDSHPEFAIRADGLMGWGSGDTTQDVWLYREDPGVLTVDGTLKLSSLSISAVTVDTVQASNASIAGPIYVNEIVMSGKTLKGIIRGIASFSSGTIGAFESDSTIVDLGTTGVLGPDDLVIISPSFEIRPIVSGAGRFVYVGQALASGGGFNDRVEVVRWSLATDDRFAVPMSVNFTVLLFD